VMSQPSRCRDICPTEPKQRVLDGVLGLVNRAQHPVRDGCQARPMGLEALAEPACDQSRARLRGRVATVARHGYEVLSMFQVMPNRSLSQPAVPHGASVRAS
jgi:hypothetical protein